MRKFLNFPQSLLASVLLSLFLSSIAIAQKASYDFGQRVEFDSIGLQGETRKVWGYLSMPKETSTPVAAIVLIHGSGGLGGREVRYVTEYKRLGIATLVLAPFEVRGVVKTSEDQSLVNQGEMNSDAFGALRFLLADKRIDPRRVGIQGASKGGNVALSLAMESQYRSSRKLAPHERFALHISIYPGCTNQYRKPRTTGKPILLLHGEKDDYTSAAKCQAYTQALKANGANVEFIGYSGAYHGFDSSDSAKWRWYPHVQNTFACLSFIETDGSVTDEREGKTYKNMVEFEKSNMQRPCVTRGAHVGVDFSARKKSLEDMTQFLVRHAFVRK